MLTENRNYRVTIRFTPLQYEQLTKVQRKTHYSMSHFIRIVLLEKVPRILDKETINNYKEILRVVSKIGNNINQIAKAHNALAKTKVHFSQNTQQVIRDTLEIIQTWERYKKPIIQLPVAHEHDTE
jgi:heterodisulfide reductase subunit C